MKYVFAGLIGAIVSFGILYMMCALYACSFNPCYWSEGTRFTCSFMGVAFLAAGAAGSICALMDLENMKKP